jgi:hypothetical protein
MINARKKLDEKYYDFSWWFISFEGLWESECWKSSQILK